MCPGHPCVVPRRILHGYAACAPPVSEATQTNIRNAPRLPRSQNRVCRGGGGGGVRTALLESKAINCGRMASRKFTQWPDCKRTFCGYFDYFDHRTLLHRRDCETGNATCTAALLMAIAKETTHIVRPCACQHMSPGNSAILTRAPVSWHVCRCVPFDNATGYSTVYVLIAAELVAK